MDKDMNTPVNREEVNTARLSVRELSSLVSKIIQIADVSLGIFVYDRSDDSVCIGQSISELLRFPAQADNDMSMSRGEFLSRISDEKTRREISECLELFSGEGQPDITREYVVDKEDGSKQWMRLGIVNVSGRCIGVLKDITKKILEKQRAEYEHDYDSATGLIKRQTYRQRIWEMFCEPEWLKTAAFIMVDLDNLKYVNDTYGLDYGDKYIRTAANVLKHFRKYGGIISRLSGDEFSIFLSGFSSKDEIRDIINEVRDQMHQSYLQLADGTQFRVRASAGVAWYPDDSESYEMLMKYSDYAMYTIKHTTKGGVAEFNKEAYIKDSVLFTGVEEMNRIIEECRVKYAFHSIISARTGEIYGYEALMRPQSEMFRSPLELLRIAKTGAKHYEIERLTWTKALADFKAQIDAGNIPKDCHIFINSISDCALAPSDADDIEETYRELVSNVVLEVLESEKVNEEYNERKRRRMKKWNAHIALDDFGTGYNSEFALITIQPDIIKIDRSIISGCDKDMSRLMIISSLIELARAKNVLVLAEGVETEGELRAVIECGVDLLQGYYISRPVYEPQPVPEELVNLIKSLEKGHS